MDVFEGTVPDVLLMKGSVSPFLILPLDTKFRGAGRARSSRVRYRAATHIINVSNSSEGCQPIEPRVTAPVLRLLGMKNSRHRPRGRRVVSLQKRHQLTASIFNAQELIAGRAQAE